MGFLKAPESTQVAVVDSDIGRADFNGTKIPKVRLWVLGDQTAVICVPSSDPGKILRSTYAIHSGSRDKRAERIVLNLFVPEQDEPVPFELDTKGCGCGFGVVTNAAPIEGTHHIVTQRAPEWFTLV